MRKTNVRFNDSSKMERKWNGSENACKETMSLYLLPNWPQLPLVPSRKGDKVIISSQKMSEPFQILSDRIHSIFALSSNSTLVIDNKTCLKERETTLPEKKVNPKLQEIMVTVKNVWKQFKRNQ